MSQPVAERSWGPLSPIERRVLGVLIEKQKTTPDSYPMTVNAVTTACNQKSNRDPLTAYDAADVEDALLELRKKGAAVLVDAGGRVLRWKHQAYDWLGLKGRPTEMAILAELLLRGPQTEGELRQRASRMDLIPDLATLQTMVAYLNELGLVVYLTPPGQKRGVVVCHGLYPPDELERLREQASHAALREPGDFSPVPSELPELRSEIAQLRDDLDQLRAQLSALSTAFEDLKRSLGA
ncbi:MAG: UPF0502 protein [Isosphaeraceae bacterium]|jgi:uncharacterized protein YceH (UPF0502 family)|nr:MAG: UPF0502 protein [Isosphaeraceae bacterium]